MDRREKARVVAERVASRIHKVTPEGLGHWGPTWGFVDVPSDSYMDALAEWETEDTPTSRSELEAASTALSKAWAEAARHGESAGRRTLDEADAAPPVPGRRGSASG